MRTGTRSTYHFVTAAVWLALTSPLSCSPLDSTQGQFIEGVLHVQPTSADYGVITSQPAGIDCGNSCNQAFPNNASVTLTATPQSGGTFVGWGGNCQGNGATCTVTVSGSTLVTAAFRGSVVIAAPNCMDTIKNGAETDTDCGGTSCSKCALTKSCMTANDCASAACYAKVCVTPALETEPNNTCEQAISDGAPGVTLASLPLQTDVDWFAYQAAAGDVGKVVHVVTAPGDADTNTLVEVFEGTCAALNSLGGPSADSGIHEDFRSTPITKAGMIFVKVANSPVGHNGSAYTLTVTYE